MAAVFALTAAAPIERRTSAITITPTLGNYPDTALLLSSDTTVIPDAAPTNAASMNVSTSTNFKGKLEANPTTGVVRVTDAHPAGMYSVTVRAFDSVGASATKTFTLTVTTPVTCTPVSFAAAANYNAVSSPWGVAVGDFNGDGKQDLAVANYSGHTVSIFLGDGAGHFSAATNFFVGAFSSPPAVAVGDFNGDGKQDLAIPNDNDTPSFVSILLGDGAGNFSAPTDFNVGRNPHSVAVGDFNGDGKQDIAAGNNTNPGSVSILLGNGAGNFSAATNFAAGPTARSVAVGDFNGDGKQDLAVANTLSSVSILFGDGAGHFGAAVPFAAGSNPQAVAVGDFNGDSKQDLAVANIQSNNVSVLLGDGAGIFSAPTNFAVGSFPDSVAVGDFNGDGKQDLAVANVNSNNVSILLGNGDGTFNAAINFGTGSGPRSLAVGDFNGDGKQDLTVPNLFGNNVSILLHDCVLSPTSIVSRMTHGGAGSFDINLPLMGSLGIECRTTDPPNNDYTMIVTFPTAVTADGNPQAQVTSGTGTVSNGGMVTISGNTVTIPLANVTNAQTINVTLFRVNGGGSLVIPMGVLVGDVNGSHSVNATDVSTAKIRVGQAVDATNFRADVLVNGAINSTDVSTVKLRSGTAIP